MSFDVNWDLEKYKEEHESDEHWLLRRNFMERWKPSYPEERLVCLARVFANIEFMGCRYPTEVMQEVATMSKEVANDYRNTKKTKLQRTFVSASDAAEDRVRGVKRTGGIGGPPSKTNKIEFVKPKLTSEISDDESESRPGFGSTRSEAGHDTRQSESPFQSEVGSTTTHQSEAGSPTTHSGIVNCVGQMHDEDLFPRVDYLSELSNIRCLNVRNFRYNMFKTKYGHFVMLVRSWVNKLSNIQASCQTCGLSIEQNHINDSYTISINGSVIAETKGPVKQVAKKELGEKAWDALKEEAIVVLVKEQFIAQNDTRISVSDVSGKPKGDEFGTPIENSVATKMMKMMGWKGGGLGADAQGISEPIKPHLQMVNRAGLGSMSTDIRQIKRAADDLMRRYIASDCLDVDLVFSSEFTKEERAAMHISAKKAGLVSRSYGKAERFLVVKKKLDPFSLVQAVIEKGGNTPKYQVFIPAALANRR